MLLTLRIENFAIVKHLELDFKEGMTAFTGETGAGKSIMIDALGLLLGGRADPLLIRHDEEKCDLSASFHIAPNSEPWLWLKDHDLDSEHNEVLIRRILYAEGRSKCTINGQLFPIQKVKELSEMLVHIHGQHEHQTLLQHGTHRQQLDRFAAHENLVGTVATLHHACQQIKEELDALKNSDQHTTDKSRLLQFQIDELTALRLHDNEMDTLNEEHQLLHHAQDYLNAAQQMSALLHSENELPAICEQLNATLHILTQMPAENKIISNIVALLNSALIQCEEGFSEIQHFAEKIQLDPARLQEVEERLGVLHQMARKYHVEISELPQYFEQVNKELEQLNASASRIASLETAYQSTLSRYQDSALKLRASRKEAAKKLSQAITAIIKTLGMPKGHFEISMTPLDKIQAHGLDKIDYLVCTNPGMPLDSLQKVASGGELSRISLAIQMITAQQSSTPTLLFDEVDVGIGGATAALVGKLLRYVGERLQVFCVTHQPQVASCAHHHFLVEKSSDNKQTYSSISPLANDAKINEIARMLGGLTITPQTLSHAQELLLQSQGEMIAP
ncbi:MAG: DNA repair protein RecN [Legionellales bacterium RIFCSPHIGHO2_12_FULL_42_9]|nr:MAG: DNA repair protein RecN [Legionellales bacterium RIFCSPHIGHO2_12_FULL_42_9]